ncbi:hypothetical protein ACSBR1_037268 [Camellia fascicularis]
MPRVDDHQLRREHFETFHIWFKEHIIMGRKRKPDHPRRMMSDVLHNRTSVAPPSEEASHRPASEGPLVPPPSEGPLVPPHRPPSVAPQQLPCTQPPRLPSVRPPSVAPQQLSSSAYEPSADPSTSSQPTSGHVSSSSTSTRRGRGCAKGIKEWGTGKKLDIQFDGNYCPIGDNVAKLTTQLGIIVRNEEYKPICMKNCNSIWKDHKNKLKANQWEQLVEYWRTSDAEKIASRNAKNRRAHGIAHTTGRTTFSQIQHEMTSKGESTDKMNVWLMTRRVDDPEDEFNRQLSMLPEDGRTLEARNAIFHELIGHDGHGYCRTYERIVPRRAVYKDGVGPSQSTPQPSTIDQITQQVRAELRDELREELRAEFSIHLQQMRAEMMALVSQGASVDPNRQVPDASSGHRAFRESAEDENPYTPPPEDQMRCNLQDIDTSVLYRSVIPPSATDDQIVEELYKLMTIQTRVFIVHMILTLASPLFIKVKEVGMMSEGYVWIITNAVTNELSLMDPSVIDSMEGVLGVKPYVPRTKQLQDFTIRWKRKYQQDNPTILNAQLNVFGLWAYNATTTLAIVVEQASVTNSRFQKANISGNSTTDLKTFGVSQNGPKLLQALLNATFRGLSGDFHIVDGQFQSSAYQIVNVISNGKEELDFG